MTTVGERSWSLAVGILLIAETGIGATRTKVGTSNFVQVQMNADMWHAVPDQDVADAQFLRHEGFPDGVMLLQHGAFALNSTSFHSGTIDLDIKPVGNDFSGVRFRSTGTGSQKNAEEFYIRNSTDCRASNDCVQYAPVLNGFMLWNVFPQFQSRAFVLDGWNHLTLRISEHRLLVFLNGQTQPSLEVDRLQGNTGSGAIELTGSAYFANVQIDTRTPKDVPDGPGPDLQGTASTIVRRWSFSPVQSFHLGSLPQYKAMRHITEWTPIQAEDYGYVDLNRYFATNENPAGIVWLRTQVLSGSVQTKHVSLGWIGQAWIFVNGELITTGKNFYYPESERRAPDGRLSLQNGTFDILLHKGSNELVVAIYDSIRDQPATTTRYGWGIKMSLDGNNAKR